MEAMGQTEKYGGLTVVNAKGDRHFNGTVRCHEDVLDWPLRKKKPLRIFVNSMSDLFHRDVPFDFIDKVFAVMALCPQHTFQVLTKRPERMAEYTTCPQLAIAEAAYKIGLWKGPTKGWENSQTCGDRWIPPWPLPNVWLGTSVEDQKTADKRIPHLLRCPAAVRFLSVEPMLGSVDLFNADGDGLRGGMRGALHWVIVGGESGPGARPIHPDWVRAVRDQCVQAGVPYFFKQWGEWRPVHSQKEAVVGCTDGRAKWIDRSGETGFALGCEGRELIIRVGKKAAGAMLDGREHREWPAAGFRKGK